ncbi:MAG: MATE family efflux transporter [Oscillospiraceae bacterium]|nr:MATE family efflux transporter [Oscillospiraceae bacterium]
MRKKEYFRLPPDNDKKYLGIFTRDKEFYRSFFSLLVVISLQQLAALAVNLVDNFMLGSYNELALSGATLVNQIQFILQQLAMGIGAGIVVLGSQYWGQKRIDPIKKIINLGVKCGLLIGLVFFAVTKLFPHAALSIFTNDEAVIAEGMRYLEIMCWTYIIFSVSNSLMYALQSVETAAVGTVMSISTIIINMCLNYCFIYGNFGAPEMGIVGAAVATFVSRCVELVIILVYVLFIDKKLRMRLGELLRFDFTYLRDYIKVATPVVVSGGLWGVAQGAQTAVLGHIGATVIAANSIAVIIFQIFAVFGMSCANVGSVVMGKTVGEGRFDKVRSYSKTMQGIFLCLGIASGALLFICKDAVVSLYSISDETKELALQFITVLSITTVGTCYEFPVESGIIAGGGMTKYQAWVDNLFMWLFTIPSAFLSAFVFNFPPIVTFCFLKADQLLKCIPNSITCNRYRWVRILTREDEQVE